MPMCMALCRHFPVMATARTPTNSTLFLDDDNGPAALLILPLLEEVSLPYICLSLSRAFLSSRGLLVGLRG